MTEVTLNSTPFLVEIVSTNIAVEVGQRAISENSSGVTDHGALTGLADDDHTQYHNDARGDARYSQLGHTHTASQITDFSTAADARISAQKGVVSGLAELDSGGKVPAAQLPSYVDDVLEYTDVAAFPVSGTAGIIYVALDTNKTYRWSGSAYVEISPSPGSTDSVTEGSTNKYFTAARAIASVITGFVSGAGTVADTDTILQALQKIVGNLAGKANSSHTHAISDVTGLQTALDSKLATIAAAITCVFDGMGAAITAGSKVYLEIPFAMTITGWTIIADQTGSAVVDVWKDTYANYPPVVGDSIAGSEKPTLTAAAKNQDLTLTTWTTLSVAAGDTLVFNVDSASTVQKLTVVLRGTRAA